MRLLMIDSAGSLSFTKDLADKDIPPYVILSHTWGKDTDEVTYQDVISGHATAKVGYEKIKFCAQQAKEDGCNHIWVDTCCIDKTNSVELSEAINSMFNWYAKAVRCYVYLSDVFRIPSGDQLAITETLERQFHNSRWLTRGWTLQELLAPREVDFFSAEWQKFGDKRSLEREISDVTQIPIKALRGAALPEFSIVERISWQSSRRTTKEEDLAYAILGICGVSMPLIYGEGKERAMTRLRLEIDNTHKGTQRDDFSLTFSLSGTTKVEHFVARSRELEQIRMALSSDGSRRTIILHGLGGIGKTQLAIAYANRYRDRYSAICWLNAKDEDSLRSSFAETARRILREHPSAKVIDKLEANEDAQQIVEKVRNWLSLPNNTRWLLIFDNVDNPRVPGNMDPRAVDIRHFFPQAHQGSIVVTTRSSQLDIGHRLQLKKFDDITDSLKILSDTSNRGDLFTGMTDPYGDMLVLTWAILDADAVRLAKKLDGFPLALATAGAYLYQSSATFAEYLVWYNSAWKKLQETSPCLMSYEDRTLYSTWQVSVDQVKERNHLSEKLLCLWAYFDHQDLWIELLRHSKPSDPSWIQGLTHDELDFHQAVRVLCDHGLAEAAQPSTERIESGGYSIHSCVHSWTKNVLNPVWTLEQARFALRCIASHVPQTDSNKRWLIQRRLLGHASSCLDRSENSLTGMDWAYYNLGNLYADQGKLAEAEKLYLRALQGYETALGPNHTSTLQTINNLGVLYDTQGKLVEAEEMYRRALQGYETALGPDHTSTLETINNLGVLYDTQGKLTEAEEMYQRALQGHETALGPDHTSTLHIINNLGALYRAQGKFAEAEEMYRRVLQGHETALGPDHTSTLHIANNLGVLYYTQGKLAEAEEMYRRALQGYETTLGLDHISTLETINNLGLLYAKQEKLAEAEEMYQRALQGYETALGKGHISTLEIVNNLGLLYAKQEKLIEADRMYQRGLRGKSRMSLRQQAGVDTLGDRLQPLRTAMSMSSLHEAAPSRPAKDSSTIQPGRSTHAKLPSSDLNLDDMPSRRRRFDLVKTIFRKQT